MRRTAFAVIDDDGDFQGIDSASGYPYKALGIASVKYFKDFDEAAKLVAVMTWNRPNHDWAVVEVELVTRWLPKDLRDRQEKIWNERNGNIAEAIGDK